MSTLELVTLADGEIPHAGRMRWVERAGVSADGNRMEALVEIGESFPFLRDGEVVNSAWMEMMAQTAAAGWAIAGRKAGRRVQRGYLAAVGEYRVQGVVRVGESVRVCGELEKQFGKLAQGRFEIFCGERLVAESRMTFFVEFE